MAEKLPKKVPESSQEAPKTRQNLSRILPGRSKMAPRRFQDATKTAQEPQDPDPRGYPIARSDGVPALALDFRSLWAHFGTIVGAKFALRKLKNLESNFNAQEFGDLETTK